VMLLVHPRLAHRVVGAFSSQAPNWPRAHNASALWRYCLTWAQRAMDGPGQFLRLPAKNVQFYTDTDWLAGNDSRQPPPAID